MPRLGYGGASPALSNLLLLLPQRSTQRLLVVHAGQSPFATTFQGVFDHIEECLLSSSEAHVARMAEAIERRPDMVVLDLDRVRASDLAVLHHCVAQVFAHSPANSPLILLHFKARSTRVTGSTVARALRALRRHSIRVDRLYYASPSLTHPWAIVPAEIRAVLGFDALSPRSLVRQQVRRLLIQSGLHEMLFDDVIVVGSP